MSYHIHTKRGYSFPAVSSAMQKAIRRGDARMAGYWALELWASGFGQYVWRRLLTVSAENCQRPRRCPSGEPSVQPPRSARLLLDSNTGGQGSARQLHRDFAYT
jgi:hypothetical protein